MEHWRKLVFYLLLLIIWEFLFYLKLWEDFLFPSPWQVMTALVNGFLDHSFWIAIFVSMQRVLQGYLLSLAIGIPLGVLTGRHKIMDETFGSLVLGLQTLPSICWLPLALLWFGLNEAAIIFIVVMGAIFSISLATDAGVKNTPPLLLKAAKNMGASGWRLYLYVILPAALPTIATGMKLGWSFAWRSLMAGELLASGLGLGQVLMMGRDLADMSQVLAVMFIIATIGLITDRLVFTLIEKRIRLRWGLL